MTSPGGWNRARYDGSARDAVESFFVKATAPDASRALWIRATSFATAAGEARAEGWAIAFDRAAGHRAAKHTLPYARAAFGRDELDARWTVAGSDDHLAMTAAGSRGLVTRNGTRIGWELRFEDEQRPFVLLPAKRLYESRLLASKTVTPAPDMRVSGRVQVDGATWTVERWRGMQGHNWQRRNGELYAWTHCNQWTEPDLVFEAVSVRLRLGGWVTPPLTTACLRHAGRDHLFNGPLQIVGTRVDIGLRNYRLRAEGPSGRLEAEIDAGVDDLVGLHYPNPDGSMTYCLNAKLARASLSFEPTAGKPVVASTDAAALEIGTRDPDHGVRMVL